MGVVLNKTGREAPPLSDRAPCFPDPKIRQGSPFPCSTAVQLVWLGVALVSFLIKTDHRFVVVCLGKVNCYYTGLPFLAFPYRRQISHLEIGHTGQSGSLCSLLPQWVQG